MVDKYFDTAWDSNPSRCPKRKKNIWIWFYGKQESVSDDKFILHWAANSVDFYVEFKFEFSMLYEFKFDFNIFIFASSSLSSSFEKIYQVFEFKT